MTEGYNEYYLCGDRSLQSEIRDQVLTHKNFDTPPEYLRNRMAEIAEIIRVKDPYDVSVITDKDDNPFNYRVELDHAFTKEQLFELETINLTFESVGPRAQSNGETVVIWLKDNTKSV